MKTKEFSRVAESLRQYRRAELKDFESEINGKPVDLLYVDPLPNDAVFTSVISSNTTFLLGRKGTGKSTVFARAQSYYRNQKNIISIYLDVKSISDVVININSAGNEQIDSEISSETLRAHLFRKSMLGRVLSELLIEISAACEKLSIWDRWTGRRKKYDELKHDLERLANQVKSSSLEKHELPILQKINTKIKSQQQSKQKTNTSEKIKINSDFISASIEAETNHSDFDEILDDNEYYNEYSDVILRSFPFEDIINEIRTLLNEAGLSRIVVFFDDFSELKYSDQRLFTDIILSPLNNSSQESIKLKIAGYPGRIYYGKIDPSKSDTINLDFVDLYETNEVQEMEQAACNYAHRLLLTRFTAFGINLNDYFDINTQNSIEDYMMLLFRASFNVPRIMGHILQNCYLEKISKGSKINSTAIKLASRKYYDSIVVKYFDRMNRFALESFENKLDRNNQKQFLETLIAEVKTIKRKIVDREIGGSYFNELGANPPVSHFIISPELESIFTSLEANFFLSRYKKTRDKEGKAVIVYALFMGLTESERLSWGYPEGRAYRNYFVQRCFDYSRAVREYLSHSQTIRCSNCGFCHPMEDQRSIERFGWRCPECIEGICSIVTLSEDFKEEVEKLDQTLMLDPIELEIITTLKEESKHMRAGEIAALIDVTHQFVGRRTSKLKDMGLVEKTEIDNHMQNSLTQRCLNTYFD